MGHPWVSGTGEHSQSLPCPFNVRRRSAGSRAEANAVRSDAAPVSGKLLLQAMGPLRVADQLSHVGNFSDSAATVTLDMYKGCGILGGARVQAVPH